MSSQVKKKLAVSLTFEEVELERLKERVRVLGYPYTMSSVIVVAVVEYLERNK